MSGIAFQMMCIIGVMAFLGYWLDKRYSNTQPIYTIIFSLLGIALALYQVFVSLRKIADD